MPTFYLVGSEDPFVPLDGGHVTTVWGRSEQRPPLRYMLADWSAASGVNAKRC